jgi:hypothetical protein
MVNTDPSSESDDESAKYQDVVDDSLGKIEKRLIAQAKAKAKNPKEFLAWLDALKPESGPSSIQTQIDELYAKTIGRLNDLAASTHSAEELSNAI